MWPVNTMGVCALCVISDPSCFDSTSVEFGSCARVNPDELSPFRDTREIGFVAIEFFIGCDAVP